MEEKRNPISPLFLVHKIGYSRGREARDKCRLAGRKGVCEEDAGGQ